MPRRAHRLPATHRRGPRPRRVASRVQNHHQPCSSLSLPQRPFSSTPIPAKRSLLNIQRRSALPPDPTALAQPAFPPRPLNQPPSPGETAADVVAPCRKHLWWIAWHREHDDQRLYRARKLIELFSVFCTPTSSSGRRWHRGDIGQEDKMCVLHQTPMSIADELAHFYCSGSYLSTSQSCTSRSLERGRRQQHHRFKFVVDRGRKQRIVFLIATTRPSAASEKDRVGSQRRRRYVPSRNMGRACPRRHLPALLEQAEQSCGGRL